MMETDLAHQRQQAHSLLDTLPGDKLSAVYNLLQVLSEPLSSSLALAPVEQEELNAKTGASLHLSYAAIDRGESVSHETILREFGL